MAHGTKSGKKSATSPGELLVCSNPSAMKRYAIEDRIECGLVLTGSEVKSMRARHADLEGAYAAVERGELWLHKMHIGPYAHAGSFGHDTKRKRKLLAKRHEIEKLGGKTSVRGYTLVPLRVYFKGGYAKVELGLGKQKDLGDRRESLKRDADMREARSAMARGKRRG